MKRILALALVLAVCGTAHSAFAASDTRFKIFGAAAWVAPMDDEDFDISGIDDTLEAADAFGWSIGFEFQFTDRLGIEVDYINATQDIDFGGDTIAEVDFQPISASLNIHLIDSDVIDLYIAPTASWVNWGDIETTGGGISVETGTDTEFAWGAQIGLDIGLGDRVCIVTGLRYLNLDLTGDDLDGELGVNPLIARAGIGIRF
ncbi:MAG: outer membrane beta-barrel protein [Candidatus Polarisedimenticolia bacterium]